MRTFKSTLDESVNFVEDQLVGFLESRYVRKVDDYFICYLSSQTGCNKGCKFCHLTATGQLDFNNSDYQDYLSQTLQVFRHYRKENKPAKTVHFNLMARGEPLANESLITQGDEILMSLANLAVKDGLIPKFNISTIMPKTFKNKLQDIFKIITPTIYYSLYTLNPEFRKKWMPAAMEPEIAFDILKDYQNSSKKILKIHHAFIKGENDSLKDLEHMCDAIDKKKLICEFNLVRYNPFSSAQGEESDESVLQRNLQYLSQRFAGKVQMIPRVGPDCKASCGMFVE